MTRWPLEVHQVHVDGVTALAELRGTSTTSHGMRYDNTFCWICRFDSAEAGATIVEVRAYLDSAMASWTVNRIETRSVRSTV